MVGDHPHPRQVFFAETRTREDGKHTEHFALLNERLPAQRANPFGFGPVGSRKDLRAFGDVRNFDWFASRCDHADLAHTEREATKEAVQIRPLFARLLGTSRAGDQMQTGRLVQALVTHMAVRTEVARSDQPNPHEGGFRLTGHSTGDELKHPVHRPLLCHIEQEPLEEIDIRGAGRCSGHHQ